jgi:hypothetical protein
MVMITKIKKIIISLVVVFLPLLAVSTVWMPGTASAATCGDPVAKNAITFFPAWYDGLLCPGDKGSVMAPSDDYLGDDTAGRLGKWVSIIAMNIVTMILYVVGYVSLGFIIYGGFKYMTSGDNSSGTLAARKTITNAVIGLVLSIMSVAIVSFVAGRIVA